MYEVLAAEVPYCDMRNDEVFHFVNKGGRLSQPTRFEYPDKLFRIMLEVCHPPNLLTRSAGMKIQNPDLHLLTWQEICQCCLKTWSQQREETLLVHDTLLLWWTMNFQNTPNLQIFQNMCMWMMMMMKKDDDPPSATALDFFPKLIPL